MSERTIVFGDGALSMALSSEIRSRPELGINLLGYLTEKEPRNDDPQCVGTIEKVAERTRELNVDRIIVTMADRRGRLPVEALLKLKTQGVRIQDGSDVFESISGKVALDSLRVSWLLFSPGFRPSRFMLVYKRAFDVVCACCCLALAAPIMLLAAIAISLDSPGPAIFRQSRLGKDGKRFTLFKFRSMYSGHESNGVHVPAAERDPRVTRVGHLLRRSRLDELPQLFNILKGNMSFVGPRPFVPDQEEENVERIPFYSQRWAVKPGATGWAQVHRGYCATLEDNIEKLSYDLFYIKNMSIGLDVLIVFHTIKILLLGRGGR